MPHIPAFVYLVCFFTAKVYWRRIIFRALFSIQFSALHYFIFSVYTNLNFNRIFSSTFKYFCKFSIKNITIWHFYSNFSTPAIFLEEMEPMFVIHIISIATDDDIINFGHDINIYPVYLSKAIIICGNCLYHCFRPYFLSISCKLIWELTYGHWVYIYKLTSLFRNKA